MKNRKLFKWLAGGLVFALLLLIIVTPAQAFEPKGGDTVVIAAGEVIEGDLYVGANTFILEGTVKGDLIVMGSEISVGSSGVVEGDFMAAGQTIAIEGKVQDDARIAGMALIVADGGSIGDDLISFGYSLETEVESTIGGDLVFFGAQAKLGGEVAGNATVNANALEINGTVEGSVDAEVGDQADAAPFNPMMFIPNVPSMPNVPAGLTIGSAASISGKLTYTAAQEVEIPEGTVTGSVTRLEPTVSEAQEDKVSVPTPGARILSWFLKLAGNLMALLLIGLLLAWLAPSFMRMGAEKLRTKPLYSFGYGIVGFLALLFIAFLIVFVTIFLAFILGMITLGNLVSVTVAAGVAAFSSLALAANLSIGYISKLFVSYLVGLLILARLKPDLAEHRAWPMVIGVIIFALLVAIPILGWFINVLVVLFGLGAIVLLLMDWWQARQGAEPAKA